MKEPLITGDRLRTLVDRLSQKSQECRDPDTMIAQTTLPEGEEADYLKETKPQLREAILIIADAIGDTLNAIRNKKALTLKEFKTIFGGYLKEEKNRHFAKLDPTWRNASQLPESLLIVGGYIKNLAPTVLKEVLNDAAHYKIDKNAPRQHSYEGYAEAVSPSRGSIRHEKHEPAGSKKEWTGGAGDFHTEYSDGRRRNKRPDHGRGL